MADSKDDAVKEDLVREALNLLPYIENLTISHGRAAEILDISKEALIDLYGDMGIPYIKDDIHSIKKELIKSDFG